MDSTRDSTHARWAAEDEIISSLHRISLKDENICFGGIPLYADSETVYINNEDNHSLIIGSTGSKKTRLIGMPALYMYARAGESFIATDPKAELYERTLPLLREKGYRVFILNLRNPGQSNSWNPLAIPYRHYREGRRDKAIELVNDMADCMIKENYVRDPYWQNSAADMLTGLIITLFECGKENEIHLKSLRALRTQAFQIRNNDDNLFIKEHLLDRLDNSSFIFSLLSGTVDAPNDTRSSIISVFDQAMRPFFTQDNLIDMLSGSDLNLGKIGKEKTAVFLITPDENTLYHRLISVFVKQCYTELIQAAQGQASKTLPRRVNFLLDEFSSLPQISDFPAMITASRSRNIRFNLIIQSMSQLYQRYGEDAETIKSNCESWVLLYSRELPLLNEIISMGGVKNNKQPLISLQMLQTLDKNKGEALIIHKRLHPFIANIPDINRYPGISLGKKLFKQNLNGNSKLSLSSKLIADLQIDYPVNKRKVQDVFNLVRFCFNYKDSYYTLLFTDKKPPVPPEKDETDYISSDDDFVLEPNFTSTVHSDEEILMTED